MLLLLLPLWVLGQVTTDPTFVIHDQPLTIYYDASKGVSDLQGATKVYMHAGVVTSGSENVDWKYVKGNWGKDDGVGQMEKVEGEADIWKITIPSPREYFGVPANETIYRIGMVFRNADGTKTGKNNQNGDIFVQVYEGFALTITQPAASTVLASAGEQIMIQAKSSESANFTITIDGQAVYTQANTTTIEYAHTFNGNNDRQVVEVSATNGTNTAVDQLEIFKRIVSPTAAIPSGLQQGLNKTGTNEATFVLLAPGKESVFVVGDFTNWELDPNYLMKRDGDLFWLKVSSLDPSKEYAYYYLVDQTIDVADPYSEKVLDKDQDQHITSQRYPDLRPFPAEAATNRLTAFTLNENNYEWQASNYSRPGKKDLIIYELLVRDFTAQESFQGVIDRLDYLDSLHITAIQLLPIMEFAGNDSWGYNPTFMTALDKWYGTKNKLKELIDKAHQRGMAVILDITLNHQDYPNPFLKMWWAGSTASADNPFFFPRARHPFNVFIDMDHSSAYTKQYLDNVSRYWLEEYKVDGFRFDLSKGFSPQDFCTTANCDTNAEVAAWSAYNQERIDLLKRMATQIWQTDPDAYVILEHLSDNSEEKELANAGMLLWGNLNHNYGQAVMGYDITSSGSSFNWLSYKARGWDEANLIGYMESHDEERLVYKAITYGNSSGTYTTKDLKTALDRVKLAAAFFIPVPGPKMIWQFGEVGYDVSIDFNGRVGKKPVRWEYLEDPDRQQLYRTFSALNYLKTNYPVFETENFEMTSTGAVRTLKLNGADMNVLVVGNFGLTPNNATVSFQHSGWWYSYFYKDSIQASSSPSTLSLQPGEFRFFFDKPIFYRGGNNPLGLDNNIFARQVAIFPNPSSDKLMVTLPADETGTLQYQITDAMGRNISIGAWQLNSSGYQQLTISDLPAGLYFLQIQQGQNKTIKRFIKK